MYPMSDSANEIHSYMYQTAGHNIIEAYAQCFGVPLFRAKIGGHSTLQTLDYNKTDGDEVEDLFQILYKVTVRYLLC